VSIRITAPTELTCISNGKLRSHRPVDDVRSCWNWYVKNPINTANITINVGNYIHFSDTLHSLTGVETLDYYVLPQDYAKAKKHFGQTKRILHCFEALYGPYPWWEDGYKVVEAPFIGMDHQSAIAYGHGFSNEHNYSTFGVVDYILLHETAHEWWGNSITACDDAEQWLHEGFATYSEALYIEKYAGKQRFIAYLNQDKKSILDKNPLVGPTEVGWTSCDRDIYDKGSWVLHSLRGVINDDSLFFGILHDFATTYAHHVVCSDDFIAMVNQKTGQDFASFFQHYLYECMPPTLEYFFQHEKLYCRWVNVDPGFRMPVDIIVNLKPVRVYPGSGIIEVQVGKATKVVPDVDRFYINPQLNAGLPELYLAEKSGKPTQMGIVRTKMGQK
jgi:aminopeptidase N